MRDTKNTFASKSNAVRSARKAGLDCTTLTFFQTGIMWSYRPTAEHKTDAAGWDAPPAVVTEPADETAFADGVDETFADAGLSEAEAGALADCGQDDGEAGASRTTDADLAEVQEADELAGAEPEAVAQPAPAPVVVEVKADESDADLIRAILAEEAAMPAAQTYVVTIKFQAPAMPTARRVGQDWAKRLGFDLVVDAPDGSRFAVLAKARKAAKPASAAKPAGGAAKAPKAAKPAATAPTGHTAQMIALALRAEGVTRPQLAKEITDKNLPWTQMLKIAAGKWGYVFESSREKGGNTVYKLTPTA